MAADDIVSGSATRAANLAKSQKTLSLKPSNIDKAQAAAKDGISDPTEITQTQSLNNRAADLTRLLDGIGQSLRTLETADSGVKEISTLIGEAFSVVQDAKAKFYAAKGRGEQAVLEPLAENFVGLRNKIDEAAQNAGYRGINLLKGDNLQSYFNEDRKNSLLTKGTSLTAQGLGLDAPDFSNIKSIDKTLSQIRSALNDVRIFGAGLAKDLLVVQSRRDFTEQTIDTLNAGVADLTGSDIDEEGAKLLALRTAQQLSASSSSLASPAQQSVLRLF